MRRSYSPHSSLVLLDKGCLNARHRRPYAYHGPPPRNLLRYFPDLKKNQDEILFGSDRPGIKGNIKAIKNLPLPEETKIKILGLNTARILRIEA